MKLLHISDLHLGIRVGEFRLLEEQAVCLDWIVDTALTHHVDGILLAGDIYDRTVPPVEAMSLLDHFLDRLQENHIPLFAISGNHDSPERIAFGSTLFEKSGIYFSPVYDGQVRSVLLERSAPDVPVHCAAIGDTCTTDPTATERVYIHLLPFLKPIHVRLALGLPDDLPQSYSDAMAAVLERIDMPRDGLHILVCHQFLVGSVPSESEEVPLVGTLDAIDASLFSAFDYVALGHLHRAQMVGGNEHIRYAGTLLPYAFSETEPKGCILLDTEGGIHTTFLPTPPGLTRTLSTIEGSYDTLTLREFRENCPYRDDYLLVRLDEATPVPDAMAKLSLLYPHIVKLQYKNALHDAHVTDPTLPDTEKTTPIEVFRAFYERQNGTPLSSADKEYLMDLLDSLAKEGDDLCDH